MKRLEIAAEARRDLEELEDFSVRRFGGAVASSYLAGIREALAQIRIYPEIGVLSSRIRPPPRVLSYRSHRIYYDVADTIIVLRILHAARDAAPLVRR